MAAPAPAPAPTQYDSIARIYTDATESSLHNTYIERPAMRQLIGNVTGLDVLDLGCGTMILGSKLLEEGAASVTGVDGSSEMLHLASQRIKAEWKPRVSLAEHDLNRPLHLPDAKMYDLIVSSLALHYLEDWKPVLGSAHILLKPRGRFILSVHHPFADWVHHPESGSYHSGPTLLHEDWDVGEQGTIRISFYRRSLAEICRAFTDAGWIIQRIEESKPTEESKALFEAERWERVAEKPNFILFVLVKKEQYQ
ncbi:S-adenosyl-L-methionine-dependent methyltransferase [Dacryopinax primogenitus]|uniref:S-adenosyl-L-methionine-dependent methyltransferase n=1 Tax=Dacryopinax primogenitus (strain DJM 731) TaxID=1858805 RepID=M5GGR3_DACPD|nr:S-adenosyl-L-methionine-dependent methyltransferase [Dacryopinax primogenitus]EJU05938.1 S-adenosyl-L-methionine-dependent methyltransferase [Dacryopinax primogenitus]